MVELSCHVIQQCLINRWSWFSTIKLYERHRLNYEVNRHTAASSESLNFAKTQVEAN